ncbi:unnamed protein product [Dovyalis caffra]|uniref:Uncharacterized protein n=1 Tax=Dovyalis caffra TaxID=77055 RepID=A0AAV1QZ09_9ROSI|nr:unnamed protein product [Dovyalis caffra]
MSLEPLQEEWELQDFDDAAETLSLCDLPLNSCSSDRDDSSKEDQSLGTSFDQDFFEFFSEGFTASTYASDNIIFCGKLIPYKGETEAEKAQSLESAKKGKNTKKRFSFPWKSSSSNKTRTASPKQLQKKSDKTLQVVPPSENHGCATKKCDDEYDFSMKKAATAMKPRRCSLAFGVGSFPMEMDLNDIKMRQSRKSPSRMFQSVKETKMNSGKRGKGLWSLLRVLGGNSHHSSAMAKASFGCAPIV